MIHYTLDAELVAELRESFDNTIEGERLFYHKLWEMQLIPFDVREVVSDSITQFGFLGDGPLIGRHVKVGSVPAIPVGHTTYDFSNSVGVVVGDCNGRIVVRIENIYFGWLEPGEFEFPQNYVAGPHTLQ